MKRSVTEADGAIVIFPEYCDAAQNHINSIREVNS